MKTNNQQNSAGVGIGDGGNVDINKIVLELFETEFPGAPSAEVEELVHDVGRTILIESLAMLVESISQKDEVLGDKVRTILEAGNPSSMEDVKKIAEICQMPHINIDMEDIIKNVATDVVKDVLRK